MVFYKEFTGEPNPDDQKDDGTRRVARASYVFNAAQIDGYTVAEPPERLGPVARIEAADRFLTHTGARIEAGGERAYYRPSTDAIHMPDEGLFTGTDTMNRSEAWYATALHESTHWSGAKHRLNRDFGKRFGDQAYVAEELVAEIASAFLCAELSVTQDTRPDHAQYLAHWLKLLKDDNRAIFTAAAKASEAVTYLKSLQPPEPEPPGGRRPGSDGRRGAARLIWVVEVDYKSWRSKLLHLRHPLEGDLAGLIGRGIAVDQRAFAEFLVHGIDGAHELRVPGLVEQVRLMLLLGSQARERDANAQGLQVWHLLPNVLQHMQQHAGVLRFREAALVRPGVRDPAPATSHPRLRRRQ